MPLSTWCLEQTASRNNPESAILRRLMLLTSSRTRVQNHETRLDLLISTASPILVDAVQPTRIYSKFFHRNFATRAKVHHTLVPAQANQYGLYAQRHILLCLCVHASCSTPHHLREHLTSNKVSHLKSRIETTSQQRESTPQQFSSAKPQVITGIMILRPH
jgi:hypothetical protein